MGEGQTENATSAISEFVLDTPQSGINGIRIVGPDGGTASDGFIGILELEVETYSGGRAVDITSITASDGMVGISFVSDEPDNPHILERSASLMSSPWQEVTDAVLSMIAADEWQFTTDRLAEDSSMYYRVRQLPPPPLFEEDFESGAEGSTVETVMGDTPWAIGEPVSGPGTAYTGTMAAATQLDGNYGPALASSLRSPVIDLTGIARPRLRFWYWLNVPDGEEGAQLRYLNTDGVVIAQREAIFTGDSAGWQAFNEVIPADARDQAIIIELRFLTNEDDTVGSGMVVDDFLIED